MTATLTPGVEQFEAMQRLSRDLKVAARDMPLRHARYVVDTYYQIQQFRIATGGQIRAAGETAEPSSLLAWIEDSVATLENNIRLGLKAFAGNYRVGEWLMSLCGIGPVISAGLLANIDIRKAPTVGQLWRFAGLDPSLKWLGKEGARAMVGEVIPEGVKATEAHLQELAVRANRHPENLRRLLKDGKLTRPVLIDALARRPWSNSLKCLCVGKAGDSFVKQQSRDSDFYGAVYARRKAWEAEQNEAGAYAAQAAAALKAKNYGKDTASYQCYTQGKLPPLQLHNRARRYAVKLFLSHVHQVMFEDFYGRTPPKPYAFDRMEGHRHFIEPPNWPGEHTGRSLRELLQP